MDELARQAYLARIGIRDDVERSPEGLAQLHLQHLRTVPFENLSLFLDEPVRLDEAGLLAKLVTRRRGGFCYEVNEAFARLLDALGFDVSLLSAEVFDGEAFGPAFDHLLLRVRFDEGDYLADVGFGDSFLLPLPLAGSISHQPDASYRLVEMHGQLVLERCKQAGHWRPQYRFTLAAHAIEAFAQRCAYHQHSPESHFTQKPLCSLARPDGRISLAGTRLILTLGADRLEQPIGDSATLRRSLGKHFGIDVDVAQAERLFAAGRALA
ncbi:MAG: arylamine N-acetyltransferase [Paludibacterium sp.]|uniref:arylamine N-acetyltransferase family protein n=1 Tax=Paludibacterium sp. TaxID=1917523 RepID=UPI0025EE9D99|nr:arylamine N-acetyltransferase [Paludibacterium sp.]MBV8049250.1 arylamine N-acetyltransferase [Paludibacterium sp.]MBV8648264.1 arylamine N-acetyltransferase [Paludibacterium sp.]